MDNEITREGERGKNLRTEGEQVEVKLRKSRGNREEGRGRIGGGREGKVVAEGAGERCGK